jgi:hypothetical protein
MSMKRKPKKKIEQMDGYLVSMVGLQVVGLVLISFVTVFFFPLLFFLCFLSPTLFSLLDFIRKPESVSLELIRFVDARLARPWVYPWDHLLVPVSPCDFLF